MRLAGLRMGVGRRRGMRVVVGRGNACWMGVIVGLGRDACWRGVGMGVCSEGGQ